MKTKKILETLVLAAACMAGQAGAAPVAFEGSTITATYNGSAAGALGFDQLYQPGPGSNITAFSATDMEFITGDAGFIVDFLANGIVTVWRNEPLPAPGDYRLVFDFAGLAQDIGGLTLLDTGSIGTFPGLSVLDGRRFALDLSNVTWNGDFVNFTLQVDAAAAVPEPGGVGLLLIGAAGFALSRRRPRA